MLGRFATGAGSFVPFVAGLSGFGFRRFLAYAAPTVAVWASAIMLLGYVFGENLPLLDRVLSRYGWVGLGLLIGLIGVWIVRQRLRRRRAA